MERIKKGFRLSVTSTIILTNIVFFITMLFLAYQTKNPAVITKVAITPATAFSKPWTFITSMFMHGNFFHIFVNMLSMFFLGTFLERLIGRKRFFWLYLAAGLAGGLFFVLFSFGFLSKIPGLGIKDPLTPAVGASGALFGLGGTLALLTPRLPVYVMFIPVAIPLWLGIILIFLALWLVTAFTQTYFPKNALYIGNAAHLGGLVVGLAFGLYLRLRYPKKVALLNRLFSFRRF